MNEYKITRNDGCLQHHGIPGQKWGIRRFQNEDGSLTDEGKARYGTQRGWEAKQMLRRGKINLDTYESKKKADTTIGKIDNLLHLGTGRAQREFMQRHKKGIIAASAIMASLALTPARALPFNKDIVYAANAAIGALGATSMLAINDLMVNKAYNKR